MKHKLSEIIVLFLFLVLFFNTSTWAATTGKITGQVIDQETGDPLPGTNMILTGTNLGAVTDQNGQYFILNVPVGRYNISASMMGYTKLQKTGVLITIDQITTVNFSLEPTIIEGSEVTVVAERDILHKEVSSSQVVTTNEQILEAPAIRTVQDYLAKQVGLSDNLSIRGGSTEQTGSVVDGLLLVNNRLGTPETAVPLSAVEQISVKSGGYNAETGNYRSGIIEIVTKTGSRTRYNGRVDFSFNDPHQKRFGRSMYDINNHYLRPYLDANVAFAGTEAAWADNDYLRGQYDSFKGWNALADDYNSGKAPEEQATPLDLYLWAAWMHTVDPPWDQLAAKGYDLSRYGGQNIKEIFANHAHENEGEHSDWNVDVGFGGPVPFVGKFLGDATFYISHNNKESYFVIPVNRHSVPENTTMLKIQSNITNNLKLSLFGYYQKRKSVINSVKAHEIPTGIGPLMPVNNIGRYTADSDNDLYVYMPDIHSRAALATNMFGFTIDHVLSPKTYWSMTLNRTSTNSEGAPPWAGAGLTIDQFWETGWFSRSGDPIVELGPIKLNDMPYGFSSGSQVVGDFKHTTYEQVFGMTRRFAQVGACWFDSTYVQQYHFRFDISSQITVHHLMKAGIQVNYNDLHHYLRSAWFGHKRGTFTFFYDRFPWDAGIYLQDQITYGGMIANLGLRLDRYNANGNWPKTSVFSKDAYGPGDLEEDMMIRWEQLGILEPVETYTIVSPRLGLSFPITERSKFYFNYGHFRGLPPWVNMYQIQHRPQVCVQVLGNPNMEPARTISYETGVEYNLLNQYLIRIAGYYKDVTGQHGNVRYTGLSGESNYQSYNNNNYEDIRGLEISITKSFGEWITGWANFDYRVERDGNTGRSTYFEDPTKEATQGLYAGQEDRPLPRPRFNANLTFHTPMEWGPKAGGIRPLGGWLLSLLPSWQKGRFFTWNPLGNLHLQNNLRWPDRFVVDLRMAKRTRAIAGLAIEIYLNINNLFNTKVNNFAGGYCFQNNTDRADYLKSLHLPMYDSPEFDTLREQFPGQYVAGDDEPGDLRSDDKSHINDPNRALWMFVQPRDIWFGFNVYF